MDIWNKKFVRNAIADAEIGQVTPRKYFDYKYTPKLVAEALE